MIEVTKQVMTPNKSSRKGCKIDCILLRNTGSMTAEATIRKMTDPKSKISCHFIIPRYEEQGVIELAPMEYKAWHAGRYSLFGQANLNLTSVSVQLVGENTSGYSDWQYRATAEICAAIVDLNPKVTLNRIIGHDSISGKNTGPGNLFNWELFFDWLVRIRYNLGLD